MRQSLLANIAGLGLLVISIDALAELSDRQVMNGLTEYFALEASTMSDGTPRRMAQSKAENCLGILENQGKPGNLKSSTLMIGIPNNSSPTIQCSLVMMLRFLHNVAPGNESIDQWASAAMAAINAGGGEQVTTTSTARISMRMMRELGMLVVKAEPK